MSLCDVMQGMSELRDLEDAAKQSMGRITLTLISIGGLSELRDLEDAAKQSMDEDERRHLGTQVQALQSQLYSLTGDPSLTCIPTTIHRLPCNPVVSLHLLHFTDRTSQA